MMGGGELIASFLDAGEIDGPSAPSTLRWPQYCSCCLQSFS